MPSTSPQNFGTPLLLEDYTPVPPPLTTTSPPLCAVCHSPTHPQRCSTCKSLYYCSSTCQARDWPTHKHACKSFAQLPVTGPRPHTSYKRALFLPDTRSSPRWVWMRFGDDGRALDMGRWFPGAERKTIAFQHAFLPYWVQISYDANAAGRVLAENKCVERLLALALGSGSGSGSAAGLASRGETATASEETVTAGEETADGDGSVRRDGWRGPLVVLAYSAEDGLGRPALDVDPSVLGPVVEYLRLRAEYGGPVFVEQPQEWYGEGEWQALVCGVEG